MKIKLISCVYLWVCNRRLIFWLPLMVHCKWYTFHPLVLFDIVVPVITDRPFWVMFSLSMEVGSSHLLKTWFLNSGFKFNIQLWCYGFFLCLCEKKHVSITNATCTPCFFIIFKNFRTNSASIQLINFHPLVSWIPARLHHS